jgi:ubiquinone/menaquinone biosynthesis C-methylase UbiE
MQKSFPELTDNTVAFAESIPRHYDEHLGPLFFDPYASDLVGRLAIDPGDAILELACGTGIVTRRLVEALPLGASLTATDLNEAMLEIARGKIDASEPVTWQTADACALPFGDEWFNTVVCQFGVMFFPDKTLALREAHRVLQPGGMLAFNVWDSLASNPIARIAHEVIGSFFTSDPPGFYRVPFAMHDVGATSAMLEQAGFQSIDCVTVPLMARSESARHAATGLVLGNPVVNEILQRGTAPPGTIVSAVAERLGAEGGTAPLTMPMRAHIFTASRP